MELFYTETEGKNVKMEVKKKNPNSDEHAVGRYGGRWGHATKQK